MLWPASLHAPCAFTEGLSVAKPLIHGGAGFSRKSFWARLGTSPLRVSGALALFLPSLPPVAPTHPPLPLTSCKVRWNTAAAKAASSTAVRRSTNSASTPSTLNQRHSRPSMPSHRKQGACWVCVGVFMGVCMGGGEKGAEHHNVRGGGVCGQDEGMEERRKGWDRQQQCSDKRQGLSRILCIRDNDNRPPQHPLACPTRSTPHHLEPRTRPLT